MTHRTTKTTHSKAAALFRALLGHFNFAADTMGAPTRRPQLQRPSPGHSHHVPIRRRARFHSSPVALNYLGLFFSADIIPPPWPGIFPSALAWRARNREAPPFSSSITASHHVIKRSAHPFCVGPKLWPHFYFCLPSSARTVAKKKRVASHIPAAIPCTLRSLRFSCFFPSSSLLVSIIVVENGQI